MQTQIFLREHGLAALCERFHLQATRHELFPSLVMLKYHQIFSPMGEPIVQQCRGLILDEADDWRVVSHPFDKFFNAAEGHVAPVDWTTARVFEKLDGSLMSLYFYEGAWQVASSGRPDASGRLGSRGTTMAQGFWDIWHDSDLQLPPDSFAGWWFGFELMTPWNQVIVRHETPRLACIGARQPDGNEVWPHELPFGWPTVASFPLGSLEDVLSAATQINPMNGEGFVVCDANFHRVKIKSPQYVALHHLRDRFSLSRIIEVVRAGESDEFLAYFPDLRPQFEDVRVRFETLVAQVDADFAELRAIETPRDYAGAAQLKRVPAALFALRYGKARSAREFFAKANIAPLIAWLGLREEAKEEEETTTQ
jgi:hypothetical protein